MTQQPATVVYREIGNPPPILLTWLDERDQLFNVLDPKGREHLYVDNEQPRDAAITPMIVEATIGFSLFTPDGEHLTDYSRLDKALRAQAGAKLTITPEVELEDEMEDPEPAPKALSALEAALQDKIAELEAKQAAAVEAEDETIEDA